MKDLDNILKECARRPTRLNELNNSIFKIRAKIDQIVDINNSDLIKYYSKEHQKFWKISEYKNAIKKDSKVNIIFEL